MQLALIGVSLVATVLASASVAAAETTKVRHGHPHRTVIAAPNLHVAQSPLPGNYVFRGGSPLEQANVTAALSASGFDWSLVPVMVTIHIVPGSDDYWTPGQIWLDPDLLSMGTFAWGTVQHEYAHQVDWSLLTDGDRSLLGGLLGGNGWGCCVPGERHEQANGERFASTLAWSYWPSPDNALMPRTADGEAGGMPPDQFRALLANMVGAPNRG